jgi:hypothetical protein
MNEATRAAAIDADWAENIQRHAEAERRDAEANLRPVTPFRERTLNDHAESWAREQGREIPPRGTPEYEALYNDWIDFAFKDFREIV